MKKYTKNIIRIVFLTGIIGGSFFYWKNDSSAKVNAQLSLPTVVSQKGTIIKNIVASGNIEANYEVITKIKASGTVMQLPYDFGDIVKKNDLLLKLDPKDEEYNVKKAEIALVIAQIKSSQAQQEFLIAKKDIQTLRKRTYANLEVEKIEDIENKKSERMQLQQAKIELKASEEKLKRAENDYTLAKKQQVADVNTAKVNLDVAAFKLESVRTQTERTKSLYENSIVKESEYETAKDELVLSEFDYKNTKLVLDELKVQELSIYLKEKDVQIAKSQVNLDKTSMERLKNKEITSIDLINATIDVEELSAKILSLKELEQNVQLAEEQVKLESLALKEAKDCLDDTVLYAPFDGIIIERHVQLLEQLNVNNDSEIQILTMADISKLYVIASVDETDIGQVELGQMVKVTLDAYPDRQFDALVDRISAEGVSASNVVTFDVKIQIQSDQANLLKPGMTADIDIIISQADDVVSVPLDAVYRKHKTALVMVASKNGSKEERKVKTGISDGINIAILEGLEEGEKVFLNIVASNGKWSKNNKKSASLIPMGGPRGKRR